MRAGTLDQLMAEMARDGYDLVLRRKHFWGEVATFGARYYRDGHDDLLPAWGFGPTMDAAIRQAAKNAREYCEKEDHTVPRHG